jgi:hypothetical protein
MSETILGQKAYQAYCIAANGTNGLGQALCPWDKLTTPDKAVWAKVEEMCMPYQLKTLDEDVLGKIAYDAYCGHVDWKSYNGDPLPQWADARENIREGWRKAGMAAMFAVTNAVVAEARPLTQEEIQRINDEFTAKVMAGPPIDPFGGTHPNAENFHRALKDMPEPETKFHVLDPQAKVAVEVGDEQLPVREGALKYELIPDDGSGCQLPTAPFGMTAEELGPHITGRLVAMERQGHWRNSRMESVPLQRVEYHIRVEEPMEEDEVSEEG